MSASARRRANQEADQIARYPAAVADALASDDPPYDDGRTFRAVPCAECGTLLLGCCDHPRPALTIPAGTLQVGDVVRVTTSGTYDPDGPKTATISRIP